ncbi:MAG TPA: NYN domain-containing protein [Acidimicrobiales bacterium]|nr:NYN domain-containing protein [Acidimicrobiales bacterium]
MIRNELVADALEAALVVAIKDPANAPKTLQRFLKFQKMPATAMPALRKALDTDDAFRERVAGVITPGVIDEASTLFLTRPDGWEDELEQLGAARSQAEVDAQEAKAEKSAQRKLKSAEAARVKAEERVKDLSLELDRAKAALEQERVARRQAETTAHNVTWDVDNLRKRVRELEAAAAAWDDERAELMHRAVASPEPSAPPIEPVAAPDLGPVVDALQAARDAFDAAARAVDDALAATPVPSGEPALAERRIRPQKHMRRPVPLPGGVRDDSDEAARFLLRLRHVITIVDGYNVAKRAWPELPSLVDQRDRLIDRLIGVHASTRSEIRIVFDGTQAGGSVGSKNQPITVQFTEAGVTADDEILRIVPMVPRERPVVVASSDREVADGARRLGANVISAEQLLAGA